MAESFPKDFKILDFAANITTAADSGDIVTATLRAGAANMLQIVSKEIATGTLIQQWEVAGENSSNFIQVTTAVFQYDDTGDLHPGVVLTFGIAAEIASGVYHWIVRVIFGGNQVRFLRLTLNIVSAIAPTVTNGLSQAVCDLRWDVANRTIQSDFLSRVPGGIKAGDILSFAVIPTLDGAVLEASVTSLTLAMKAPGEFESAFFEKVTATGAPIAITNSPVKHYPLSLTLGGAVISGFFAAQSESGGQSPGLDSSVAAMAELRIVHNNIVYTSETFTFPILRSVN